MKKNFTTLNYLKNCLDNGEHLNPKAGTKVFAKVKSDETSKEFFWLLDLPNEGEKLVLNENNLFTVPANSP